MKLARCKWHEAPCVSWDFSARFYRDDWWALRIRGWKREKWETRNRGWKSCQLPPCFFDTVQSWKERWPDQLLDRGLSTAYGRFNKNGQNARSIRKYRMFHNTWGPHQEWTEYTKIMKRVRMNRCPIWPYFKAIATFALRKSATA